MSQEMGIALEKLVLLLISIIPTIILLVDKILTMKIKGGTCIKKETTDIEMHKQLKKIYPDATIQEINEELMKLKEQNYKQIKGEKETNNTNTEVK